MHSFYATGGSRLCKWAQTLLSVQLHTRIAISASTAVMFTSSRILYTSQWCCFGKKIETAMGWKFYRKQYHSNIKWAQKVQYIKIKHSSFLKMWQADKWSDIYIYIYIYIHTHIYTHTHWPIGVEGRMFTICQETRVQSQDESYQRLEKWYLMPPCLIHNIIKQG